MMVFLMDVVNDNQAESEGAQARRLRQL